MKMLRKNIDCENLETSQKNFYDGVFFRKVASLQCLDRNFVLIRTHDRFFLKYEPKTGKEQKDKKSFLEKKVYGGPES